jgi:hypothetical protein
MPGKKIIKAGRPPLPKGEGLDSIIPASRCKSDERELYEKAAKKEGLTLTQWVRKTLNQAIK